MGVRFCFPQPLPNHLTPFSFNSPSLKFISSQFIPQTHFGIATLSCPPCVTPNDLSILSFPSIATILGYFKIQMAYLSSTWRLLVLQPSLTHDLSVHLTWLSSSLAISFHVVNHTKPTISKFQPQISQSLCFQCTFPGPPVQSVYNLTETFSDY